MSKRRSPEVKATAGAGHKRSDLPEPVAFALILCATLVAYLPALQGGLLWDDPRYVTRPELRSLHGLWRIWTDLRAADQYYPLLHSAFWVEHLMWGGSTVGYHLTNVALHALSALLVVLIVRRLKLPGAWLAGLVFALHPVCVESVAWITEQKNTLSAVFYLASALAYLHFDESRRKAMYFLALGSFALALASKSATVALPVVLLVVLWWLRGRLAWRRDVLPLLPWAGLAVSFGMVTTYVEHDLLGASGTEFSLSLLQRVLLAGRIPLFYACKLLWPVNLVFYYPRWTIDAAEWWQYLFPLGLAMVAVGLGLWARRNRAPLAAFLVFGANLVPVLGFLSLFYFRYSFVADHFQYLASLAIIVPVAALATSTARRLQWNQRWCVASAGLLLVCLAGLTWRQSSMYTDAETLYRVTLEHNPDAWLAHDNLGTILLQEPGRRMEAMEHFQAAIRANPDYWEAHVSLGNVLLQMPGRVNDGIAEYRIATRLAPESIRAITDLGNALVLAGRFPEAVVQFEHALRIEPDNAVAHRDLATALANMPGRLPDAIAEYEAALRANPDFAEAHNDLGHVLALTPGRLPDAIVHFQEATRIQPDYWGAHSNLGTAYAQVPGRLPDAIAEFEAAARIRPDLAASHMSLGAALSRFPNRLADAAAEFRRALQIDPKNAEAHYGLAALLTRLPGGEAESRAEYETAMRLKSGS